MRQKLKKMLTLVGIPREILGTYRDTRILREIAREFQPDVVFLQTLQYPSFLAFALPRNLPMLVTFWNGDVTHYAKWTGIEMILKKRIVTYGVRRADAITVNSRWALEKCQEHGASPGKARLIRYPGVDLSRFRPGHQDDARKRLKISSNPVVLCPRGLGSFFNSDVIIEAAAQVVRQFPDVLFLFISGVGGQEEWRRHLQRARDLGISKNLRWDGQVPWEEMPVYYQCANVVVSILTYDSMPNCMIEAMACGVPVVLSDTPPYREWVSSGTNGFLCPYRDSVACASRIIEILRDPAGLAARFSAINRETVGREADSAVNCDQIKKLVRSLVLPRLDVSVADNPL
jgi:glycosyltransferase involved in cell wall biosynthesis